MSCLALLKPAQTEPCEFSVLALHFNFWVLPKGVRTRLLKLLDGGHRPYSFFLDVGVRFSVSSGAFQFFDIVFPVGVQAGGMTCLSALIQDENLNNLIFGVKATSSSNRVSYASPGTEQTVDDAVVRCKSIVRTEPDSGIVIYRVELSSRIQATQGKAETVYVRFRVPVSDPGRLWQGRGWGFAKRGVASDVRVLDIRETGSEKAWDEIEERVLSIPRAFLFVIVPPDYVPAVASPMQHYVRLLEGKGWEAYLKSCGDIASKGPLTIHQWRNRDVTGWQAIAADAQFRTYVYMTREFGWDIFFLYMLGGAIGGIVGGLVSLLVQSL